MSDIVAVYHANCSDGMGAAWCFDKAHRAVRQTCDLIPVSFLCKPVKIQSGKHVYFLDFCYPREVMKDIADRCQLTILDHHKTAYEECHDLPGCEKVFDMGRSGAGITWDYFFPGEPRPSFINYIEDRDLWRYALPYSQEVNAAIESYPLTIDSYNDLSSTDWDDLKWDGKAIKRYKDRQVEMISKNYIIVLLNEWRVAIVNSSCLFPEVANSLVGVTGIGGCWYMNENRVVFSLRSDSDIFDVADIAGHFGGGGHKKAAGFNISFEEFSQILSTKE